MDLPPHRRGRRVTLVLTTPGGRLLGRLPPVDVRTPDWRDVGAVADAAAAVLGVRVVVLRLLRADPARGPAPFGGPVTYLAQTTDVVPATALTAWTGPDPLGEHPLRAPYARPGGPDADLAWAAGVLAARGLAPPGPTRPRQVRTWNLSSIWRLPTLAGSAWLKVTPPFLSRESAILAALRAEGAPVPEVLGAEGSRVLLADVPGDDQYGAGPDRLLELAGLLGDLQQHWRGRADDVLALGGRDLRRPALLPAVRALYARYRADLADADRIALDPLVDGLEGRFADVETCLPACTLVHGDLHPGNVRGRPGAFAVLDWGEAGVGHPAIDALTLAGAEDGADGEVLGLLARRWGRITAGGDLLRAARLLHPVVPLITGVAYQGFLDHIEPDERVFHEGDPQVVLRRAAVRTRVSPS